jgi:hypothetical protein
MDPNIKLLIDKMAKDLHVEIKDGFAVHEAAFTKRIGEVLAADRVRDERVVALETVVVSLNKTISTWKPELDSSISAVKLELTKLNSFFNRDANAPGSSASPGVLNFGLATARPPSSPSADGPAGYRSDNNIQDGGFDRVHTQTHIPVMGTMSSPVQFPTTPYTKFPHGSNSFGSGSTVLLGKLPKVNLPKFESENPKLWQSHCKNYFDMYSIDPSV